MNVCSGLLRGGVAPLLVMICVACGPPAKREMPDFRDRVLAIVQAEFPERHFEATSDPQILKSGTAEHGLLNLYAKFQQTDRSEGALKELVKEHFTAGLAALDSTSAQTKLDWAAAKPLLRPQVLPSEYSTRIPLVTRPLAQDALEGYVLDHENTYQYVGVDDLERWSVTADDMRAVAFDNLDRASKGVKIERGSGPDKFVTIETHDGYDAARLLVPGLRRSFAEELGDTFYAAMPNRDLLIMWSLSCSPAFEKHVREVVAEDFRSQPYPLSKSVFRVTGAGVTELPR